MVLGCGQANLAMNGHPLRFLLDDPLAEKPPWTIGTSMNTVRLLHH
jgi:hypothetical protein